MLLWGTMLIKMKSLYVPLMFWLALAITSWHKTCLQILVFNFQSTTFDQEILIESQILGAHYPSMI